MSAICEDGECRLAELVAQGDEATEYVLALINADLREQIEKLEAERIERCHHIRALEERHADRVAEIDTEWERAIYLTLNPPETTIKAIIRRVEARRGDSR